MDGQRNVGLDLLRSAAIIMVVLCHTYRTVPGRDLYFVLSVDLFFAISGFLIAQMIVERFQQLSSMAACGAFLANRWLRTLPLYYLTLAVHVWMAGGVSAIPYDWRDGGVSPVWHFSLFMQDLTQGGIERYRRFFLVSWSLCVEEWFYLLCPLFLVMIGQFRRSRGFWVASGGLLIIGSLIVRGTYYILVDANGGLDQDDFYRRVTLMRFDVFVYGAAVYFALKEANPIFATSRRRATAALLGLAIGLLSALIYSLEPEGFYAKVPLLSVVPAAMAICIPYMHNVRRDSFTILPSIAAFISTRTYAIYLCHLPLKHILYALYPGSSLVPFTWLLLTILVANALYVLIERPILRLRPSGADVRRYRRAST